MKRLHINISVQDIPQSITFYSTLLGAKPTVVKPDYAKWMLDDPHVNFAITTHGERQGLDHLGIQVDDRGELADLTQRLQAAGNTLRDVGETSCCYARSDKAWVTDPQGIAWESFFTLGAETTYAGADKNTPAAEKKTCCKPGASACC